MHDRLPQTALIDDEPDDRPFRMSALNQAGLADMQDMTDSMHILGRGGPHSPLHRNRFFVGICLALPLSVLLWYLVYQCLHYLTD